MPDTRPRPSRLRRLWRYTWRGGVGIFCAILVGLLACSFDDELLDTSALRYEPRAIPENENAYLVLEQAARRIEQSDGFDRTDLTQAVQSRLYDPDEAMAWLDEREFVIESIRDAAALSHAQWPPLHGFSEFLKPRPSLRAIGEIGTLRVRQMRESGNPSESIHLLSDLRKVGRLVRQSRGDVLTAVNAWAIQATADLETYALISDPRLNRAELTTFSALVASTRPTREDFAQLVAQDLIYKKMIVAAYEGSPGELSKATGESWRKACLYHLPFLYKPRQSLNYVIPAFLILPTLADVPLAELRSCPKLELGFLCSQYGEASNHLGKQLAHDALVPSAFYTLEARLGEQTRISLAETLIALRLYHDDHGRRLPAALDELVPAYLPSLPRDYFDGVSIKYSRELRAVWSAGPEGKFQLVDADQDVHERELVLPLCFDGGYAPWPRRDPNRATLFGADNENGGPSESPPPAENP